MDPRKDPANESEQPLAEANAAQDSDTSADEPQAPVGEPAPLIPEIVPADEPLRHETLEADFSTVGTGSFFAVSCSLLTVIIIVVCVGFFILFRIF